MIDSIVRIFSLLSRKRRRSLPLLEIALVQALAESISICLGTRVRLKWQALLSYDMGGDV